MGSSPAQGPSDHAAASEYRQVGQVSSSRVGHRSLVAPFATGGAFWSGSGSESRNIKQRKKLGYPGWADGSILRRVFPTGKRSLANLDSDSQ